jgi:hypothetical protein
VSQINNIKLEKMLCALEPLRKGFFIGSALRRQKKNGLKVMSMTERKICSTPTEAAKRKSSYSSSKGF